MDVATSFIYAVAVFVTCLYSVYGQSKATPAPCTSDTSFYSERTYQCNDGNGCYSDYDKCNSNAQCVDKSDDMNCDYCKDYSAFFCVQSRQCLSSYNVCDGVPDCLYGEDEDLPECSPSIWMYMSGGQLAGLLIGFIIFIVIVVVIVVAVNQNCKKQPVMQLSNTI
ncbi:low-density lipoprotein receptor-related protein 10-like [Asterias rubens]|uniref:low-density lipoprotein receptor-related protein 10-like n=1 Tax=Asterias rubens TaxID=7604 RepID=UPI0014552BBE|nr:low-density lipoprotein receptor-related protein 10-like [Asterias rubens]